MKTAPNKNQPTSPEARRVIKTRTEAWGKIMARRLGEAEPVIRDMARRNYGAEDIGPRLRITPSTVRRYAVLLGIPLPTNGRTVFRLDRTGWHERVKDYLARGMTTAQMGQELGCSPTAVSKWILNQGLRQDRSFRR